MVTWPQLVERADHFLAKCRFFFSFLSVTWVCIDSKHRLATVQVMKRTHFVLGICSWLLFLGKEQHTLCTAMNNIYFGTFDLLLRCCHGESWYRSHCMAQTSPLALWVTPLLADQSDSVQLSWGVGGYWSCSGLRFGFEAEPLWSWPVGGGTFRVSQTLGVALPMCMFLRNDVAVSCLFLDLMSHKGFVGSSVQMCSCFSV